MCGMWHALCSTTCCSTKCCNVNCSANLADVQSHVIAVLSVPVLVLGTVLERSAAAFEHRNHPPLICHDDGCGWWTPQSQRLESVWFSPNFIWMSQTVKQPHPLEVQCIQTGFIDPPAFAQCSWRQILRRLIIRPSRQLIYYICIQFWLDDNAVSQPLASVNTCPSWGTGVHCLHLKDRTRVTRGFEETSLCLDSRSNFSLCKQRLNQNSWDGVCCLSGCAMNTWVGKIPGFKWQTGQAWTLNSAHHKNIVVHFNCEFLQ